MENENKLWAAFLEKKEATPTTPHYKKYSELQKKHLVFDASGIESPEDFAWGIPFSSLTNIYYPIEKFK